MLRRGHPLSRAAVPPTLRDLAQQPWILQPPGSPQRRRFEAMLLEAGIPLRLDITETASTIATTALLEVSDRLAVMPASLARHYARLGVLAVLPLDLPLVVPSVHLITRRRRDLSPAATGFVEYLSNLVLYGGLDARIDTPSH